MSKPSGIVEVWIAEPRFVLAEQWAVMKSWLDSAELARAYRFLKLEDQQSYVLVHAMQRAALGRFLQLPPQEIELGSDANGRPVLKGTQAEDPYFTHSRTPGYAACAVTSVGPIGIDIEALRPSGVDFSLLTGFVALPKCAESSVESDAEPVGRFYSFWTMLEAYWKAAGTGLPLLGNEIRLAKDPAGNHQIFCVSDLAGTNPAVAVPLKCAAGSMMSLVIASSQANPGLPAVLYRGLADFPWEKVAA